MSSAAVAAELSAKFLHLSSGDQFADGSAQDPTAPLAGATCGTLEQLLASLGSQAACRMAVQVRRGNSNIYVEISSPSNRATHRGFPYMPC